MRVLRMRINQGLACRPFKTCQKKCKKEREVQVPNRDCFENCMPACASCNINKHQMSLEDFRNLISGFMKHLNERNTQYKIAKRYGLVQEVDKEIKFYFEKQADICQPPIVELHVLQEDWQKKNTSNK